MNFLYLVILVGTVIVTELPAQPIYDPFNYTPGTSLAGQGGWVLQTGTSGTISAGSLAVPAGMPASTGNAFTWNAVNMSVRLPFTPVTSGSLYLSFALRVDAVGSYSGSETVAGFAQGTGTTFPLKINVISNAPGVYQLGIYKNTGTAFGALAPALLNEGDTEFVVARYTFGSGVNDDTVDLWLNPSPASLGTAAPPAATVGGVGVGAADGTQLERFFWRSAGIGPQTTTTDELRIGQTWADVTPVPEPSAACLSALAASLLLIRFRCSTSAAAPRMVA